VNYIVTEIKWHH